MFPATMREALQHDHPLVPLTQATVQTARDGTRKLRVHARTTAGPSSRC